MDFKKYFCPACGNDFTENDDVVFCPECGTPHHRECWNKTGHCINENLHGTGENVDVTFKKSGVELQQPQSAVENEEKPVFSPFGTNPAEGHPFGFNPVEIKQDTLINGKPAHLFEIAVKANQKYYIPRFIIADRGVKTPSWNFVSFLVPMAWSLYRKMYKIAALIFALYVALFCVTGYFIFSDTEYINANMACLEEDPEYFKNIYLYEAGGDVTLTANQKKLIEVSENISIPTYISIGSSVLLFVVRFFMGVSANGLYLKKLTSSIEKGEKNGLTGDALKAYIYRKNGVLPIIIAIIVGVFEWMLI